MNVIQKNKQTGVGFRPDHYTNFIRSLCGLIIKAMRLDGENFFSNEFIQKLDPKAAIEWQGRKLYFRTGHGRLKWRVDSFYAEEPLMIEWLSDIVDDDVFLDIGANVGTYALPAATQAKTVIAAEMDPINVGLLYENLFLNGLTEKVVILPFGLGATDALQTIHYRDFSKGDALQSIGDPSPFATGKTSKAHKATQIIFRLDTVFELMGLPQPNKIKIDVDGNERVVFDGGRRVLTAAREIYFELNALDDSQTVVDDLEKAGFRISKRAKGENPNFPESYNLLLLRD